MGKSLHIVDVYHSVCSIGRKNVCFSEMKEKWRNFLIVRASKLYSFRPMRRSFPKILQPVYFLTFYFLRAIHWCRWEKKYSCFLLLLILGSLSPFCRRAEERDCWGDQDIFWHSLHSKDTKMFQMLCCREGIAVCMTGRFQLRKAQAGLVWSPNSTAWKSPVWWRGLTQSWDFSFPTLNAIQVWGRQGTRWEGMMAHCELLTRDQINFIATL